MAKFHTIYLEFLNTIYNAFNTSKRIKLSLQFQIHLHYRINLMNSIENTFAGNPFTLFTHPLICAMNEPALPAIEYPPALPLFLY